MIMSRTVQLYDYDCFSMCNYLKNYCLHPPQLREFYTSFPFIGNVSLAALWIAIHFAVFCCFFSSIPSSSSIRICNPNVLNIRIWLVAFLLLTGQNPQAASASASFVGCNPPDKAFMQMVTVIPRIANAHTHGLRIANSEGRSFLLLNNNEPIINT